jgi:NADH-quinone oxidoreductase subunit F
LKDIIFDIGGGIQNDKRFKAVQTGGPSGGCIPASLLNLEVDYESLEEAGSIMGSGGLVVMDEDTCMVDIANYFLSFTKEESCGKCTPCRIGVKKMLDILQKIRLGEGKEEDIERLEELAHVIKKTSLCGLGQTCPNPVLTTLRYFREEYEEHIKKRCPAKVCKALFRYTITKECVGCQVCKKNCPAKAIKGDAKEMHAIEVDKCMRCGLCLSSCPVGAIEKV